MARKTKRQRAPDKLAIDTTPLMRDCVVTARRAKWKATQGPSERMIRMLRFIWMRQKLTWADRHGLHGPTLGAILRMGLVFCNDRSDGHFALTPEAEDWAVGRRP